MSLIPIVYSQPGCQPCTQLKTALDRSGVLFEERDIRRDPAHLNELLATGYRSTPVTVVGDHAIVGPDLAAIHEALDAASSTPSTEV